MNRNKVLPGGGWIPVGSICLFILLCCFMAFYAWWKHRNGG